MTNASVPMLKSISGRRITPEDAMEAGIRLGQTMVTVGVACDADPCTPLLYNAFVAGLLSSGSHVFDAGICPAPTACLALSDRCECIATIGCPDKYGMPRITIHHPDGSAYSEIDNRVFDKESADLPGWDGIGEYHSDPTAGRRYGDIISRLGLTLSGSAIVDCGCGCVSYTAPEILDRMGADITAINSDIRRRKPRNPSITAEELKKLSEIVHLSTGTIGFSYNGDGTDVTVLDEDGMLISPQNVAALIVRYFEPRTLVIPFDSSAIVEYAFKNPMGKRSNGHGHDQDRKVVRVLGDDAILKACIDNDADLAILSDGRMVFPELGLCPDAIYASAILLEISEIISLRRAVADLPSYISKTVTIPFEGMLRPFSEQIAKVSSRYNITGMSKCQNDYGWKILMDEGAYSVIHGDGELIIVSEASDPVYLATMTEQAVEIVKASIGRHIVQSVTGVPSA